MPTPPMNLLAGKTRTCTSIGSKRLDCVDRLRWRRQRVRLGHTHGTHSQNQHRQRTGRRDRYGALCSAFRPLSLIATNRCLELAISQAFLLRCEQRSHRILANLQDTTFWTAEHLVGLHQRNVIRHLTTMAQSMQSTRQLIASLFRSELWSRAFTRSSCEGHKPVDIYSTDCEDTVTRL